MTEKLFPDKKKAETNYQRVTNFIREAQALTKETGVGQDKATFLAHGEYPELPVALMFMTDIHYGSMGVDYDLLEDHFEVLEDTPNFFAILGGDDTDAFSPAKHPQGMLGDAITPQMQAQAFGDKLMELDQQSKIALIQGGNHTMWLDVAGYDYAQTFYGSVQAPLFNAGGVLETIVGKEHYRIGVNHTHFGNSKLNPTNAPKRMMEFSYQGLDIALVGHTHVAAAEVFYRAGLKKVAIVGGTYKLHDEYGDRWGMGKTGPSGYTIMLWPDTHEMEVFSDPRVAQHYMLMAITEMEHGNRD